VSIRTRTSVRRITHKGTHNDGAAGGITYLNAAGEEVFQPAELVFLASWTLNNTRTLLLSGMGEPYNPATDKGVVGRNLTHQVSFPAATVFLEKPLNRFMGSGATAIYIDDLNDNASDHNNLPFLGGGIVAVLSQGVKPIANFGVVPQSVKRNWGSDWKKAALSYYDRTGRINFHGEHLSYKSNYMDLDPSYKDYYGDPLLRLTLDWRDNERRMAEFATAKAVEIGRAMGAEEVTSFPGLEHYDATRYQSTQVQGGAIMGTSPDLSVVNPFLQHWQVSNLFVLGGSSFPQESAAAPTLTILALTLRTADVIVERYLKSPGALA